MLSCKCFGKCFIELHIAFITFPKKLFLGNLSLCIIMEMSNFDTCVSSVVMYTKPSAFPPASQQQEQTHHSDNANKLAGTFASQHSYGIGMELSLNQMNRQTSFSFNDQLNYFQNYFVSGGLFPKILKTDHNTQPHNTVATYHLITYVAIAITISGIQTIECS